jgi:hypothetical protein
MVYTFAYSFRKYLQRGLAVPFAAAAFSATNNRFKSSQGLSNLELMEAHKTKAANFGLQPLFPA